MNNDDDFEHVYFEEEDYAMGNKATQEFFHAPHSFQSYILTCFLKKQIDSNVNVYHLRESLWIRGENVRKTIDFLSNQHNFKYAPTGDVMTFHRSDVLIQLRWSNDEFDKFTIYCESSEIANKFRDEILQFDANVKKLSFHWIVNARDDSVDVIEEWDEVVAQDLYPFINNFDTYADRFLDSKSNILILIGEPGTGKTTFIKHLIDQSQKAAYVTYDEQVLSSDSSFAEFISNDYAGSYVIEDADNFLKSRADGNNMISRFLNIGDGLIKLKNKKLIFSTNLPSIKDMDPALIRPGRCFDILQFRKLTADEANAAASARGIVLPQSQNEYTLAEVFNSPITKQKNTFGFI